MPIQFACPKCGHKHSAADTQAGKRILCRGCGQPVTVAGTQVAIGTPIEPAGPADRPANSRPYGSRASEPEPLPSGPRKKNVLLLAAVGVCVVSMILPWISWGKDAPGTAIADLGTYISGIELPLLINYKAGDNFEEAEELIKKNSTGDRQRHRLALVSAYRASLQSLYAIWLIPLTAAATLADEFYCARTGKNRWWLRLVNGLMPLVVSAYIFAAIASPPDVQTGSGDGGTDIVNLSIGYWVVWIGALLSLASVFIPPRAKTA